MSDVRLGSRMRRTAVVITTDFFVTVIIVVLIVVATFVHPSSCCRSTCNKRMTEKLPHENGEHSDNGKL
jgi:hypothetical protein